jgi:hypothetical protein
MRHIMSYDHSLCLKEFLNQLNLLYICIFYIRNRSRVMGTRPKAFSNEDPKSQNGVQNSTVAGKTVSNWRPSHLTYFRSRVSRDPQMEPPSRQPILSHAPLSLQPPWSPVLACVWPPVLPVFGRPAARIWPPHLQSPHPPALPPTYSHPHTL